MHTHYTKTSYNKNNRKKKQRENRPQMFFMAGHTSLGFMGQCGHTTHISCALKMYTHTHTFHHPSLMSHHTAAK